MPALSAAGWDLPASAARGRLTDRVDIGADTRPVEPPEEEAEPEAAGIYHLSDASPEDWESFEPFRAVSLQPQPLLLPQPQTRVPTAASSLLSPPTGSLFSSGLADGTRVTPERTRISVGPNILMTSPTDAGSLFGRTPAAVGVGLQRRTPIVNDPRIRGARVGQLAASGSYWVPARIDLDTMLNKLDARILASTLVVKGPYSVRGGPGMEFIHVDLLPAPRYPDGPQVHATTSADYQTNGQQIYGRQFLFAGGSNWGTRVSYGHRTGNDYRAGNGQRMNSSYNSRDWDVAVGWDPSPDRHWDLHYLRLDQTNVEYPGQAFDIDFLVTDGFELAHGLDDLAWCDRLDISGWYNATRLAGSAQRPGKRQQFPYYDFINFVGSTHVDSLSTGAQAAATWGNRDDSYLSLGADTRVLKQELDEISSGRIGLAVWNDANSPIPRSTWVDPGLFVEAGQDWGPATHVRAGGRLDWVDTEVVEDPAQLQELGLEMPQNSLANILGTDRFDRGYALWAFHLALDHQLNSDWTFSLAGGHGQRAPSLTELYAAQPFMFLLQNGLNTVTGDPRLNPERRWQIDSGLAYDNGRVRGGLFGFHAWVYDYITFENLRVVTGPPTGDVQQVNLKYVNTALATLTGFEGYLEWDWNAWLTPFASISYVSGYDHTRLGNFATQRATNGGPSLRVPGLPRGFFSGVAGGPGEPLPGILPLESRLGIRWHAATPRPRWLVECSVRVVDNQDRVATSLLETPTPGFTVVDLRGFWEVNQRWLLVAGVENVGDRAYREHLDFRAPGGGYQMLQPGISFYSSVVCRL